MGLRKGWGGVKEGVVVVGGGGFSRWGKAARYKKGRLKGNVYGRLGGGGGGGEKGGVEKGGGRGV